MHSKWKKKNLSNIEARVCALGFATLAEQMCTLSWYSSQMKERKLTFRMPISIHACASAQIWLSCQLHLSVFKWKSFLPVRPLRCVIQYKHACVHWSVQLAPIDIYLYLFCFFFLSARSSRLLLLLSESNNKFSFLADRKSWLMCIGIRVCSREFCIRKCIYWPDDRLSFHHQNWIRSRTANGNLHACQLSLGSHHQYQHTSTNPAGIKFFKAVKSSTKIV